MPINPSPAVQRAGQVLWYLAEHPSEAHSVAKLSRELGIPRATCDSILQALAQQGFASRRDGELGYELGASCLALATSARSANVAVSMACRQAETLARELHACVAVSTRIGGEIRPIAVFNRAATNVVALRVGHAIPFTPPFGVLFVAWDPASSQAWLHEARPNASPADLERWTGALEFARRHGYVYSTLTPADPRIEQTVDNALDPDSGSTRRARDQLIDLLDQGSYLSSQIQDDEELNVVQVSAPVFDTSGDVAATIMVLGSLRPMPGSEVDQLGRQVADVANSATRLARDLELRQVLPVDAATP